MERHSACTKPQSPSHLALFKRIRKNFSTAALVAAVLLITVPEGLAQNLPSAHLAPADSKPNDPDGGNSFFMELAPGQSGTGRALVVNPSDQPMLITLHLQDLVYNERGIGEIVEGTQNDVGAWGKFNEPEITLAPQERRVAEFVITPPMGADPGDHLGAVIARSRAVEGQLNIVKQVASRIFVTIPGDVVRSFAIVSVKSETDSALFPSFITAETVINNTGRIRLKPNVSIGRKKATGPSVLLSRTKETYSSEIKVPWYGGLVRMPVLAQADNGFTRRANHSKFVIPWGYLLLLATAIGLVFLGKKYWWDRRVSRLAAVQADLRRIESLVARRPGLETPGVPALEDEQEEIDAIMAGLKRARRTQAYASLQRLALALHESQGDALEYLIEALPHAAGEKRDELLAAAASYGAAKLADEPAVAELETDLATELMLRASGTHEPRPNGTKPQEKKPPAKRAPTKASTTKKRSGEPRRKNPTSRKSKKNYRIPPDPRSPK